MNEINDGRCPLFFAYGSNMNLGQITARCYQPEVRAVARLANHVLSFFGHSKRWDGAEATVTGRPGEDVWGVVYKLSLSDSERLDSWQDVRLDGTGGYFHYPTEVVDAQGNEYPVLLFKRFWSGEPCRPSEEYLDTIINGALFHGLPLDYIAKLRSIATCKASFAVPRIFEYERSSSYADSSCNCGAVKASCNG